MEQPTQPELLLVQQQWSNEGQRLHHQPNASSHRPGDVPLRPRGLHNLHFSVGRPSKAAAKQQLNFGPPGSIQRTQSASGPGRSTGKRSRGATPPPAQAATARTSLSGRSQASQPARPTHIHGIKIEDCVNRLATNKAGGDKRVKLSGPLEGPPQGFTGLEAHGMASLAGVRFFQQVEVQDSDDLNTVYKWVAACGWRGRVGGSVATHALRGPGCACTASGVGGCPLPRHWIRMVRCACDRACSADMLSAVYYHHAGSEQHWHTTAHLPSAPPSPRFSLEDPAHVACFNMGPSKDGDVLMSWSNLYALYEVGARCCMRGGAARPSTTAVITAHTDAVACMPRLCHSGHACLGSQPQLH